jgi:hypothetical protein
VPPVPQLWVAAGVHAPSAVHAPHGDQVPCSQVRDCVPHIPHACSVGPVHAMPSGPGCIGGGSCAGIETGDQGPHSGAPSLSVLHAVLTLRVAPCDAAIWQAAVGS